MEIEENLHNDFYKKYVGQYAKRFYSAFSKSNMYKIVGFKMKEMAYFTVKSEEHEWDWDIEDCVVVSNEPLEESTDNRIANIKHKDYKGDNPYD